MKGIAALVTFIAISFFYIGPDGYERYIKHFGHALYETALVARTIPAKLEVLQKKIQAYQAKKEKEAEEEARLLELLKK